MPDLVKVLLEQTQIFILFALMIFHVNFWRQRRHITVIVGNDTISTGRLVSINDEFSLLFVNSLRNLEMSFALLSESYWLSWSAFVAAVAYCLGQITKSIAEGYWLLRKEVYWKSEVKVRNSRIHQSPVKLFLENISWLRRKPSKRFVLFIIVFCSTDFSPSQL